ncbi:hypothetical protein WN51_00243 [Melipona quadrifasciata]|uniref:Uncharacterized protein n=1 Tax=Melipona quadrifasciata TaxID=166423 RepID=A0A0M8ZZL1_9HYME|nr:hypothetical protein WN51_00243 [Melipona quadrifasciata]
MLPWESEPASELAGVRLSRELARLPLYQPPSPGSQPSRVQHTIARVEQSPSQWLFSRLSDWLSRVQDRKKVIEENIESFKHFCLGFKVNML